MSSINGYEEYVSVYRLRSVASPCTKHSVMVINGFDEHM
jgi:hypothetical protein